MDIITDEIVLATFTLDGMHLALETTQIREAIILEQEITPFPSGVDFVEGVMDLRGTIVPLINLKKRLQRQNVGYAVDCRAAIVALQGITLGILFDGVKDVIRISRGEIVRINEALQGEDTIIDGIVNHTETGRIIEIIEPSLLVSPDSRDCFKTASDAGSRQEGDTGETGWTRRLVVFDYHGQEYGIDIDYVKEVETAAKVDTSFTGSFVSGAVSIHDQLIPLVQLDSLGGDRTGKGAATQSPLSKTGNVVVLTVDNAVFAVSIDQVREMLTVNESQLSTISLGNGDEQICFALLDNDRNIQILDTPIAFKPHIQDVQSLNNVYQRDSLVEHAHSDRITTKNVVDVDFLFFEAGQPFAIEAASIQEILPNLDVIVPVYAHQHLEGILNLRQNALPVFDLTSYLGLVREGDVNEEDRRIIVVKEKDKVIVLRVDRVLKLVSRARETTLPPLGETLSRNRDLFKSMLLSKDDVSALNHVLRFDTSALIQMLTTPETRAIEREEDVR